MRIANRKFFLITVLSIGLILSLGVAGMAQSRTLKGKVTDDKDQPVVGAQISIIGIDMVRNLSTKTDKRGQYLYLLGLQAGTFRIVVRKEGFQPQYREGVRPGLSEETEVNFKLTPGQDYKLPFEMDAKEMEEYKKQYEEAKRKEQFSGEIKAAFKLGLELADAGKYEEALAELGKALQRDPEESAIHAAIGTVYTKAGKNEDALASFQTAIKLSPSNPDLYSAMGSVLNSMGKTAESQEAFKKAASLNPGNAAQNFYNMGVTMVNSGKSEEAAEAFKQAIAADPNYAEAYYQLGMALSGKQATIPAAIEALKKYVELGKKADQVEVAKQIIAALGGK